MPGEVRSGHQSGFVDSTSEKFAITSELEYFTERFPLFRYSYSTRMRDLSIS